MYALVGKCRWIKCYKILISAAYCSISLNCVFNQKRLIKVKLDAFYIEISEAFYVFMWSLARGVWCRGDQIYHLFKFSFHCNLRDILKISKKFIPTQNLVIAASFHLLLMLKSIQHSIFQVEIYQLMDSLQNIKIWKLTSKLIKANRKKLRFRSNLMYF